MSSRNPHRGGFTLVEILIVVVILGILAAIVVPQFSNASSDARNSNLATTLASVRGQLEIFKGQHNDQPPQVTGMWTLMTGQSDTNEVSIANPVGTRWGPYLMSPAKNPINGLTGVTSAAIDSAAGWYYQPNGIGFTFAARNSDGSVNNNY